MFCRLISCLAVMLLLALSLAARPLHAAELVLVQNGVARVPVIVAPDATPTAQLAADDLIQYVEKITGARLNKIVGPVEPIPASAIWIGHHPQTEKLFPGQNLSLDKAEEILILTNAHHLLITGRDRIVNDTELEHGTANAVSTFIEKYLGVRWLWPGPLGEDVIRKPTLALPAISYRFNPPFVRRVMNRGRYAGEMEEQTADWFRLQRVTLHSLRFEGGHAYTDWWEKYHKDHPDWFALQPDGKRRFGKTPEDVKLCVSNPQVAQQWIDNAVEAFTKDPTRTMISASPNDGPFFCVCEKCRAMDHPDGPPVWGYVALTDRYVKHWNTLAQGLKQRLPDREAYIGVWAYGVYRTPPIAEKLDERLRVGFVSQLPFATDEFAQKEKELWLSWSKLASSMVYRPNLFHYTGGFLGFPNQPLTRTSRDLRFLAENRCTGLIVDSLPLNWATQGVEYYLLAQLAYDPNQDGAAIVRDYHQRAFGPAASHVQRYTELFEQVLDAAIPRVTFSSSKGRELVELYTEIYTDDLLKRARDLLDQAQLSVSNSDAIYARRVAFVRTGWDYVELQVQIARAMKRIRDSKGADKDAIKLADELCAKRETFHKPATFAVRFAEWYQKTRKMEDHMGPVSDAWRNATAATPKTAQPAPDFHGRD